MCIKKDKRLTLEIIQEEPMVDNKKDNKSILKLSKSIKNVTKKKGVVSLTHGASDIRFFSVKNIPAVMFGPIGYNLHGKNEYLDINSAVKAYNILEDFIIENC